MKKRTGIILLVVILAVLAGVGIYAMTRPGEEPVVPPDMPVEPVPPDVPEQPQSVIVYVPDEQAETLLPVGAEAADDSDQALVDAMVALGALPAGAMVQGTKEADGVLTLDMNAVYGNAVRSSGTAGENMLVYALVDTFIQARGVDKVLVTVDGAALESGHAVYDTPLEMGYTS